MKLHPEYLTKNGKKEFAILTIEEFEKVKQALEDYEDLQELRSAKDKENNEPTIVLKQAKKFYHNNVLTQLGSLFGGAIR